MRIAIGGIAHETHTFSTIPTNLDSFYQRILLVGEEIFTYTETKTSLGGMIEAARAEGFELSPTIYAWAVPSGIVSGEAFDHLMTRLLRGIEKGGAIDGVLLALHGAMVVEGIDDAEGYLLREVRRLVGKKIPVVATLDLHANISPLMVKQADILIGYDTYPHVDAYERAVEAGQLIASIIRGELKPTSALQKPPLLPVPQGMFTDRSPMKDLMSLAQAMEEEPEVITITVAGGFPYADIEAAGMGIIVTTDNDPALAEAKAKELRDRAWELRQAFVVENVPVKEAVEQAIEAEEGPVILVDVADNIGGGAPGDGTLLLEALLEQGAQGAVVTIADAESVAQAVKADVGREVELRVGGKTDERHGQPVAVRGRVRLISDGVYFNKGPYMTGQRNTMGCTVVLDCQGLDLVVMERKTPPFDAEQLRSLGIEPADKRIIVVKSAIAWRSAFGPLAKKAIEVDTPGLCSIHLEDFPFRKIRRPIFPLDEL